MFILTAFVCIMVLGEYQVMAQCAVASCGGSVTLNQQISLPTELDQLSMCFEVAADSECPLPTVDVKFMGDFDDHHSTEMNWFTISYNGGDAVECYDTSSQYCNTLGSCPDATALFSELTWAAGTVHTFDVLNVSESSGICFAGELEGEFMFLELTVTCDPVSCIIDEIDAAENDTIEALNDCFCADEITTSQTNTIAALSSCFCSEAIADSADSVTEQILAVLSEVNVKLDKLLGEPVVTAVPEDSESSSGEIVAAESILNKQEVAGNGDTPKVVSFSLAPSTEYSLLGMLVCIIGIVGCLVVYAKYTK